jgi:hypothetical protein
MARGFRQTETDRQGRLVILLDAQQVPFDAVVIELLAFTIALISVLARHLRARGTTAHGQPNRERVQQLVKATDLVERGHPHLRH